MVEVPTFIKREVLKYNLGFIPNKFLALADHALIAGNIITGGVVNASECSRRIVGKYGLDSRKLGAARFGIVGNLNILIADSRAYLGSHVANPRAGQQP